jgi:hypothetical protein
MPSVARLFVANVSAGAELSSSNRRQAAGLPEEVESFRGRRQTDRRRRDVAAVEDDPKQLICGLITDGEGRTPASDIEGEPRQHATGPPPTPKLLASQSRWDRQAFGPRTGEAPKPRRGPPTSQAGGSTNSEIRWQRGRATRPKTASAKRAARVPAYARRSAEGEELSRDRTVGLAWRAAIMMIASMLLILVLVDRIHS